jgi:hypothetical protein
VGGKEWVLRGKELKNWEWFIFVLESVISDIMEEEEVVSVPRFWHLPVPMTPIVLWDLDAWTAVMENGASFLYDFDGGLLAMLIENLEACRQNGMLRLDIDIDSVFAIMFSKLPWSNDKVKGKVFDLDIFQLPAIVRPLMIVPPPKHYTDTELGLEKLHDMKIREFRNECKDAIIQHLDNDSLTENVREPIRRALATLANLVDEDDEQYMFNKQEMKIFYLDLAVKRFTREERQGTTDKEVETICKTYLDHEKRRLMRKFTDMHPPPSKKRARATK